MFEISHLRRIVFGMCVGLALTAAQAAEAGSLTIGWDPSPDVNVAGYVAYVGTQPGVYTSSVDVGSSDRFALPDPVPGQQYYFAVAAYAPGFLLGPRSAEVTASVDGTPPPPPGDGSVTVAWDPNPDTNVAGYVAYVGTQSGVYTSSVDVGNSDHFVLSNAVDGQPYFFAVSSYAQGPLLGPLSAEVIGYSNAVPRLVHPGDQTSLVGETATLQLVGTDPDGEPLSYSAQGLPPGLGMVGSTGFITGIPSAGGTYVVTASVSDGTLSDTAAFNWTVRSGTTAPPAPTVVKVSPSNGASNVSRLTRLSAQFSADMNPATLTTRTVRLVALDSGALVAAQVEYSANPGKLTIRPTSPLSRATAYEARIKGGSGGAADMDGTPLLTDYVWSFETR